MNTQPTLLQTVIVSFLTALFTVLVIPMFITPYFNTYNDFKKYLIEARVHLRLYVNIYTNFWYADEVNSTFRKEVTDMQKHLRLIWVNVENSYWLIPKTYRWFLNRIGRLPDREEMDCILGKLLGIHNSTIIYRTENDKNTRGHEELIQKKKMIKEVNTFINLYIK
jgi:hypothetical protein